MVEYVDKKYTVETRFNEATDMPARLVWSNERGVTEAPADLPAEMDFDSKGLLKRAFWKKDGKMHRDNDLPAKIEYNTETGKPTSYTWYRDGREHRDGDKPSCIAIYDSGRLCEIEFMKEGRYDREGGKPTFFVFDEGDGTAYDIDQNVIEFDGYDQNWLPNGLDLSVNLEYS